LQCTPPKPKVITACAMFYDLEDPNAFCADIKQVLHEDGVCIIQMNYLGDMIDNLTIDNISAEHLCYYSFASLNSILHANGLVVQGVTFGDVNGGSIRVVCGHKPSVVTQFKGLRETRLTDVETFADWARRLKNNQIKIKNYINKESKAGRNTWGYGASTRGNTLLQWLGLDSNKIVKIADRNPRKWGKYTAGGNIPICSEQEMREAQPDNLLVLPYHFKQEFLEREASYMQKGGKMIFPLPSFTLLPHNANSVG
jgi:NDP-4-keto-2,6-dideoxyhexose 3-C-methyltransferase